MITKQRDEELKAMAEMRMKASNPHPYMRELALKRIEGTITPLESEALDRFYDTPGMSGGFTPFMLNSEQEAERIKYHEAMIANAALSNALKEGEAQTAKTKRLTDEEYLKEYGKTREEAAEWDEISQAFLEEQLMETAEIIVANKIYAEKGKGVLDNPDKYPALCGLQNKDRQLIEAETRASMGEEKYIDATAQKIMQKLALVLPSTQTATPDSKKEPCPVCGWKHDSKLTRFENPKNKAEFYTVKDGCDRHSFFVYLHGGMVDSGDDVSLKEYMEKMRDDGKRPVDILGKDLFSKLFLATITDRAKIRPPDFKRTAGRPRKKK
jgi:hypothetical protein